MHEHDVKSGFVIYRREAFEDILAHAAGYYYFQHMITVVAKAKGYSIRQVETLFLERRAGSSFIALFPMKMIARTLVDVVRGVIEFRLGETKDQSFALALHAAPTAAVPARTPHPRVPRGVSPNSGEYLGELERTQWLALEELRQLQLRRLRRLVQHAHARVGYYRELLQAARIAPEDLRSLDDLAQLPVLDRQTLRENLYFDLFAEIGGGPRNLHRITTSGASGEPLGLFADRFQLEMRWAHAARGAEWAGYRHPAHRARWLRSAADGPERRPAGLLSRERLFPGAVVDEAVVADYADYVRRERPALLSGDAETFAIVASMLAAGGRDAHGAGAIVTWGQTLSPAVRARIEAVFGCPVFDEYGAGEVGPLAHECERHRGHHVNAESYVVEIVRDGRAAASGEIGEVLVTDLNSRSVPLIRYRVGDLAVPGREACECGRRLPLLERIVGRSVSAVLGAGQRRVPGTAFAELFKDYEHAVARYRVVQERADAIDIRLVRRPRFTAETEGSIRAAVARLVGAGIALELEFVDALPPAEPGASATISLVALVDPLGGDEPGAPTEPAPRREVSR